MEKCGAGDSVRTNGERVRDKFHIAEIIGFWHLHGGKHEVYAIPWRRLRNERREFEQNRGVINHQGHAVEAGALRSLTMPIPQPPSM